MAAHSKNLGNFSFKVSIDAAAIVARAKVAVAQALPVLGEYIRARSTAIAPLRDGGLIASARVEAEAEKVTIIYNGDGKAVYANYQHEGEDFHHPNGRQAKYLESVMEEDTTQRAAEEILAAKMKANL